MSFKCPKCGASLVATEEKPKQQVKHTPLESVIGSFPEDLQDQLTFSEKDGFILIRPKQYLGSETFAKSASIVRNLKGEYVSAGKESHFRVPIKEVV